MEIINSSEGVKLLYNLQGIFLLFYILYKTTNLINSKFYIGIHRTNNLNDGYLGSGKFLNRAIIKDGIQNFRKDILFIFQTEAEMLLEEKILVNEEFLKRPDVYNICLGGHGGWGYINRKYPNGQWLGKHLPDDMKKTLSLKNKGRKYPKGHGEEGLTIMRLKYPKSPFHGKQHSDETKKLIGELTTETQSGKGNSQYGTCWITNGQENKKIKKEDIDTWLDLGYTKGRIIQKVK